MQRKLVLLLGIVAAVAAIALACSDSNDPADAAGGTTNDIGILAALATLADANLHHVENALIADDPEIDPAWIAPIINARTAAALVEWPEELHTASENFLNDSMPLLMALQADDLDGAVAVVNQAHASWHLLRDPGYAHLAERAGHHVEAGDHDDDHGAADDGHDAGDDHDASATPTASGS